MKLDVDITNKDQLDSIKGGFNREVSRLYEALDKEDEQGSFDCYYQLNHLVNQLSCYSPQLDYSVKE